MGLRRNFGTCFQVQNDQYLAGVSVSGNNKISYIHTFVGGCHKTRYPNDNDFLSFMDDVFEKIMSSDIKTFKNLLEKIKVSEPACYKKGVTMLQNKMDFLL